MQNKINRILVVIAITAFGMISAPTISTINTVFAADFNPFDFLKSQNTNTKDLFNIKLPDVGNIIPQSDNGKPQSDNGKPQSDNGNSGSGGKCIQSQPGTKDWYCAGTHHHCVKGASPGCLFEGGRGK